MSQSSTKVQRRWTLCEKCSRTVLAIAHGGNVRKTQKMITIHCHCQSTQSKKSVTWKRFRNNHWSPVKFPAIVEASVTVALCHGRTNSLRFCSLRGPPQPPPSGFVPAGKRQKGKYGWINLLSHIRTEHTNALSRFKQGDNSHLQHLRQKACWYPKRKLGFTPGLRW